MKQELEEKEQDQANKKVLKTIEVAADQASKNEIITARLMEHQGKLIATAYKQCHEESQKQLKLIEATEYLGNDPDLKILARNLLDAVSNALKKTGLVSLAVHGLRFGALTGRSNPSS